MIQAFFGGEPLLGVPLEAARNEVHKGRVGLLSELGHNVAEAMLLLVLTEDFAGLVRRRHCRLLLLKLFKHILAGGSREHRRVRSPDHIDHQLHLLTFVRPWEQGEAREEFNQDATD